MSGCNVYGILRAGRSSSAESLVFSAPYTSTASEESSNLHGLAVMLGLAEYFTSEFNASEQASWKQLSTSFFCYFSHYIRMCVFHFLCVCVHVRVAKNYFHFLCVHVRAAKNYWAKDIIFLVITGEEIGTQAWIDSYMGDETAGKKKK